MLTLAEARALIENCHEAWRRGDLDALLAQYTDDMEYWCNAGNPAGGPVELTGKAPFRDSLAAVLRTTRCEAHFLSFEYADGLGRTLSSYRLERIGTAVVLEGTYRQVIHYRHGLISRLEEYHDSGRLTAFWLLTSGGAAPTTVVWDAVPGVSGRRPAKSGRKGRARSRSGSE